MKLDLGVGFKSSAERIVGEYPRRIENAKRITTFGVQYLDEALGGIFPNDLIILGAKTGVGKTALSTIIAHANVKAGRRVHYFALEAEQDEIERRMKYNAIAELVYTTSLSKDFKARLNYLDWYTGKLDSFCGGDIDAEIERRIVRDYRNLHTYYKTGAFDADELSRLLLAIQDQTDLVLIDHLHYIDIADDATETRGVRDIVKRIRDVSLNLGKPVIVVAHLRKTDKRTQALIPDIDDFHGSSDITKIATKCILIAPAFNEQADQPHLWPTYIQAVKCRAEGSRAKYGAMVNFNARKSQYEPKYILGRFNSMATEFEEVKPDKLPHWAESAAL